MKIAHFHRHKYTDGRRSMYAIWLRLHDGVSELFNGPITTYRVRDWERHATNLMLDSMRLILTLTGWEVIGDA